MLTGGFSSPKNRQHFNTAKSYTFDEKLNGRCLKIGISVPLGRGAELLSWYLVFAARSHISRDLAII
jgi:hypothetical protein